MLLLDTVRSSIGTDVPFTMRDLELVHPGFRRATLAEWHRRGAVQMLVRGWYVFAGTQVDLPLLFEAGCRAYPPAYVSLETALSWYELIPETVHAVTLIGTQKTRTSTGDTATFVWRTVAPARWFGYHVAEYRQGHKFLIADAEKALLDYLYLHPDLRTVDDMLSLRLDDNGFAALHRPRLERWAARFRYAPLMRQVHLLEEAMHHA